MSIHIGYIHVESPRKGYYNNQYDDDSYNSSSSDIRYDLGRIGTIDLKKIINPNSVFRKRVDIKPLNDESFVIAYILRNRQVYCLKIIDRYGQTLDETRCNMHPSLQLVNFKLCIMDNSIMLFTKAFNFPSNRYTITKLDFGLQIVDHIDVEYDITNMCVYDSTLYCLYKPGHPFTLCGYDEDLNQTDRYGQHNPSKPFFFSPHITHFEVNDEHFVLLENGVISLMDKWSGFITNRFNIDDYGLDSRSFVLYAGERVLVYGNKSKTMYAYDMDGHVEEIDASAIPNNCWLYNSDGCFVFFNKFTFLLNFSY